MSGRGPDQVLDRRSFLRMGAGTSAGLAGRLLARRTGPRETAADELSGVPVGVLRFKSRPDLQPPKVAMHHEPSGVVPGVVVTDCHNGPGQQGPLILDSAGRLVWFKPLSKASAMPKAFNVRVQTYKGNPVISWFEGDVVQAHGQGHYQLYDASYRQVAEVHAGNGYMGDLHEFVLTDRGTALFTCYGQAAGDLSRFGGSTKGQYSYGLIQEVDVASGKVIFQWRSDEHVSLEESYVPPSATNPLATWDYFHINSINVDPSDGHLVISGRNVWAFYKIHRTTGAVIWRVGGKKSDFKMGAKTHFAFQHDVTPQRGGIVTIFDNEAGPPRQASQSRGLVLVLDVRNKEATFVRQYDHDRPVISSALGSVQDLPNGHCFIGWGESSYFTEYGPAGEVLLDGRLAAGNVSYRAFKQPWTGTPRELPAIAVLAAGTTTTVYASWNGSTETAAWRVLTGRSASHLSGVAKATRTGFETAIEVPGAPAYFAVESLNASGRVLARSSIVRA